MAIDCVLFFFSKRAPDGHTRRESGEDSDRSPIVVDRLEASVLEAVEVGKNRENLQARPVQRLTEVTPGFVSICYHHRHACTHVYIMHARYEAKVGVPIDPHNCLLGVFFIVPCLIKTFSGPTTMIVAV
jgi:hypothetical protein